MTIDRDIPLPVARTAGARKPRPSKYPFRDMQPGDSAFFPGKHSGDRHHPAYMSARNFVKRYGWRMSLRSVEENGVKGVRIWRTA